MGDEAYNVVMDDETYNLSPLQLHPSSGDSYSDVAGMPAILDTSH